MTTHECPVCSASMVPHFTTSEAEYTRCPQCEYLRAWPKDVDPLQLNIELYNESFDEQLERERYISDKRRRKFGRLLDRLEPYRQTGKFLDIGCSAGRLLTVAAERGWDGYGSDPAMVKAAELVEGFKIIPKLLHDCGFEDGMFDVVHANEVIEHVPDVRPFVAEISRILRPGGVVVFRTPHYRSWTTSLVGPRWRQFDVFDKGHIAFLTPATMTRLFGDHSMKVVLVDTHHFSLRDRYKPEFGPLRRILGRVYDLVGVAARAAQRGERLTVWGQKVG